MEKKGEKVQIIENKRNRIFIDIKANSTNKKPVISQEEYNKTMQKRNNLIKKTRIKPATFLFGKKTQMAQTQVNNSVSVSSPNISNNNLYKSAYLKTAPIEPILEEKYQNDGKTLMVENPNQSSQQSYYKQQSQRRNNIMIVYIRKINELEDIYNFTNNYFSFIINLFDTLCKNFLSALYNMFINYTKPNLLYIKQLYVVYNEFSNKMNNISNDFINQQNNEKKNSNLKINDSVKIINNIYADKLNVITNNIQDLIVNSPYIEKIDLFEVKFKENEGKIYSLINELKKMLDEFNSNYKNELIVYFSGIKQRLNDYSLFNFLPYIKDFIFIEHDLLTICNQIYKNISTLLIKIEFFMKTAQNIFFDYLELLCKITKIIYKENKSLLNLSSILSNKSIINCDKLLKVDNIKEYLESKFSFKNIIQKKTDETVFNTINHLLLNYRDLLQQTNFVKSDDINEVLNFHLINYKNCSNFIQFLLKLIPPHFEFKYKEIIELKLKIKRYSGIFKGWKNALLVITFQGHLLIIDYDWESPINSDKKITKKDIINAIIDEDIEKNDIEDNKDLYNAIREIKDKKNVINYWIKNIRINQFNSKNKKRILQIHEQYDGYNPLRITEIDTINDDNLSRLVTTVSSYNIL